MTLIIEAAATVVCFVLGAHSCARHLREMSKQFSTRRLLFWFYSAAFMLLGVGTLTQTMVAMRLSSFGAFFRIDYAALVVAASYGAMLSGVSAYDREHTVRPRSRGPQ